MIHDWATYMNGICGPETGSHPKVFHWSPAETRTYSLGSDSAFKRHLKPTGWPEPNWYDFLANVIKPKETSDAFFVRGAWGFGLKQIGKALFKLGAIQTDWTDGPVDGLAAMGGAWAAYRVAEQLRLPVTDVVFNDRAGHPHRLFQEIIAYNEVDCRVMAECIQFLRTLG
jgi:hypothetical protein